jgi:hypothetical protein
MTRNVKVMIIINPSTEVLSSILNLNHHRKNGILTESEFVEGDFVGKAYLQVYLHVIINN